MAKLQEMQLAEPMNELPPLNSAHDDDEMDLKKHHHQCTLCADDSTCATAYTSMSSLNDSMTLASLSTRSTRSSISVPTKSKRGSILKNSSKLDSSSSTGFSKRRSSRISFSKTPDQIFTIENKEEYYDDMFYDQESLADFRYEALMWEAGMVDEYGTPISLLQSAKDSKTKYDQEDEMNGSLDFDELILDELSGESDNTNPSLRDSLQDIEYSRDSIKELRKNMDATDVQWQGTSELFCTLDDWDTDDDFIEGEEYEESTAGDDEHDELREDLDSLTGLDVQEEVVGELPEPPRRHSLGKKKKSKQDLNFLNQKFSSFNLHDSNDCLVFESSDDGHSEDDDESITKRISNERAFACEDDSLQSEHDHACGDTDSEAAIGDTSERSHVRRALEKRDSLRASLQSLSGVFNLNLSQHSGDSLDGNSAHSLEEEPEENRRSRLMAKMRGLRESLRSIQDLDDIDSDDDSEWGDYDDDDEDTAVNNTIDAKNLKRSLIGKHKIYSPVPNQSRMVDSNVKNMVVKNMVIPEL